MNGSVATAQTLTEDIARAVAAEPALLEKNDFLICPPFLHLSAVRAVVIPMKAPIDFGGQDCAHTEDGAYTGDISADMLHDFGCRYVIVGHSERRQHHNETSELVAAKASRIHAKGMIAIICVGEKENERGAGHEKDVVGQQIGHSLPSSATAENTVIAYEPVWAIGTGKSATPEDIRVMHRFIREKLQEKLEDSGRVRILYGGSVKPDNAAALFAVENVDGALIGGASLKADQYIGIAQAA